MWHMSSIFCLILLVCTNQLIVDASIGNNLQNTSGSNITIDSRHNAQKVVAEGGPIKSVKTQISKPHTENSTKPIKNNEQNTNVLKAPILISNITTNITGNNKKPNDTQKQKYRQHLNKSVPRKGVSLNGTKEMIPQKNATLIKAISTTSTTQKPRKPLITEADDSPDAEFLVVDNNNKKDENGEQKIPSIESIIGNKRMKRDDFLLPIIGIILSVPLVAIMFAILYKKGSEWWQHRFYRRMDFLVDNCN